MAAGMVATEVAVAGMEAVGRLVAAWAAAAVAVAKCAPATGRAPIAALTSSPRKVLASVARHLGRRAVVAVPVVVAAAVLPVASVGTRVAAEVAVVSAQLEPYPALDPAVP